MRKLQILILALIFCFVALSPVARVSAKKQNGRAATYAPGEVIVKLKANASELQLADPLEREFSIARMVGESSSQRRAVEPLVQVKTSNRLKAIISEHGLDRTFLLKLDAGADVESAIGELRLRDDVEFAEPNYRIELGAAIPNDPRFYDQWGLKNFGFSVNEIPATPNADIKIFEAWDITTGSPDVVVAVTDTGVDINHPDLAQNIYTNPREIPGNKIDDDQNGYVDDVHGYNVAEMNGDVTDIVGHGTQVSGIIAAQPDNNYGIAGVAQVKILPVRFFQRTGPGPADYEATITQASRALIYSLAAGATIINASWRSLLSPDSVSGEQAKALEDAVNVTNDAGALLVCIAGNDAQNNDVIGVYPGAYQLPNEIVVAASDYNDAIWHSNFFPFSLISGYGQKNVAVAAPGVNIITTAAQGNCALCVQSSDPNEWYLHSDGTSMSAAFVSGVAALVKSRYPDDDALHLKRRIIEGADTRDSLRPFVAGGARLNAFGALAAQVQITITPPVLTRVQVKGSGKKLLLYGTGIQAGARAIVGTTGYSTDPQNDDRTKLLARVPKSVFPRGVTVSVKLRNPDGGMSQVFTITR
ncbi:MAG TPA: S8 family serine peptidase [Blastocatellia bacterium]|nr:S8 family serine peptidase [Blastocatellia bacterium]